MNEINTKPTILIVDDTPINIAVLYELLQSDYEIKAATNGEDALEIAKGAEKPDLILLDIEMPGMDGYEVCKELKNSTKTKNIPIIFVTAKNNPEDEEYGFNLGAVDYISKPFFPMIVKVRVKTHIGMKIIRDQLEELSMIDGLTRIPNRRYFDDNYTKNFHDAQREKTSLVILMIDVDHFKKYNDNYGHGQGDDCLIKIATALKNTIKRPTDFVSRYGGEEFVVLLKNIDADGAKNVAHNIINAVNDLKIPHEYSPTSDHVTISVGMALKENDLSQAELLKKADDALYRAKEGGRNKFCE